MVSDGESMADLLTHVAAAFLVKGLTRRRYASAFVFGTLAPDLCARVPSIGLQLARDLVGFELPDWVVYAVGVMHLPVGMLLLSWLLALLTQEEQRRLVFWNVLGGMALHMAIDLLQDHQTVGYILFFPVASFPFELGWFGTEASLWVAGPLALLSAWIWNRGRADRRKPA